MKSLAIIGAQWGDEGKGKITDLLSEKADVVVRYQGGNNAGHTIIVGDQKIVLHLIPSGILHHHCVSIIGHGVVFNPESFVEEMNYLLQSGINVDPSNLKISENCPVITTYNKLLDGQREQKGPTKIGTTGKGIGPTYEDKVGRNAIKLKDLFDVELLEEKLRHNIIEKEVLFRELYKVEYPSPKEEARRLYELAKHIAPFVCDTLNLLDLSVQQGKKILFEGAQGILLDVDYGSYPFVTSSNTSIGGIFTGAGIPGGRLEEVIGIAKAYTTRVGEGPFPTELSDESGKKMQKIGNEIGATTGRTRRCGWLDLPLLKYSTRASNLTSLALTKIDVLSGFDELKLCIAYKYNGKLIDCAYPGIDLSKVEPIYQNFSPFYDTFKTHKLSVPLENYIAAIEKAIGIPIGILTYGPERRQVVFLKDYL